MEGSLFQGGHDWLRSPSSSTPTKSAAGSPAAGKAFDGIALPASLDAEGEGVLISANCPQLFGGDTAFRLAPASTLSGMRRSIATAMNLQQNFLLTYDDPQLGHLAIAQDSDLQRAVAVADKSAAKTLVVRV